MVMSEDMGRFAYRKGLYVLVQSRDRVESLRKICAHPGNRLQMLCQQIPARVDE